MIVRVAVRGSITPYSPVVSVKFAVTVYVPAFTWALPVYSTVTPLGRVPLISIECALPLYVTVLLVKLIPCKVLCSFSLITRFAVKFGIGLYVSVVSVNDATTKYVPGSVWPFPE